MTARVVQADAGVGARTIREHLAELARLSAPVIAGRLGVTTMGLTDTIVVGRYSATELGFNAMAWAISAVVLMTAIGLLTGTQVMASRAMGEGRPAEAGAVLRGGLVYGLWIGLVAGALLAATGPWLLHALRLKGDLAEGASRPLIILAASMPAFALCTAAASWLEGLGRPAAPNALMWVANGVNLVAVLVLVPGGWGVPALGAIGAAMATFTARTFLMIALLAYIVTMRDAAALGVFRRASRAKARAAEQRRIGYGAGASNLFEISAFGGMNVVAGWIGPNVVAAWAVVLNVVGFAFMVPLGLAVGTAVMVAKAYAARDERGARRAALTGFAVTIAYGCLAALILWPNVRTVAFIYTRQSTTALMAAGGLSFAAFLLPPDGLQTVVAQSLRARGDVLAPTLTHLASYILVMVPLACVLAISFGLGLNGIVGAAIVASYISAALLMARFWMVTRAA